MIYSARVFDVILKAIYYSVGRGSLGAWQKFERGEIPLLEFYKSFSHELSDTTNGNLWHVRKYRTVLV